MTSSPPATPQLPVLATVWSTTVDAPVLAAAFTGLHDDVVVLPSEGAPRVFDGVTGVEVRRLAEHDGGNLALAVSKQGLIATAGCDGRVHGFDARGGVSFSHRIGTNWVEHLAWNPSGERLAAGCGRQVTVLSIATRDLHRSALFPATVAALAWQPEGRYLAVAAYGGAWLLNCDTLLVERHLQLASSLLSLAWSADGHRLAAGLQGGGMQVWDLRRMSEDPDGWGLNGFERSVRHLKWHGDTIAASGGLATVVLSFDRSGPDSQPPRALHGHPDPVSVLISRPDGGWITGDTSGGVLLWNGQTPAAAVLHQSEITALAWHDPELLVIGATDGTVLAVAWSS